MFYGRPTRVVKVLDRRQGRVAKMEAKRTELEIVES